VEFPIAQFLLLSQSKHFTNDAETENESLEVGRLSVEFYSAAIQSVSAEQ